MRNTTAASTAESCIQAIDAKRRKTRQVAAVLLVLGALVAVGVFWWLHSTGIALTNEVYCGLEEHQHSDACYETVLTCGLEEDGSADGHVHTDDCYETVLTCGLEEHTHTAACLSNNEADVETQADWEATLPELTGNLADDVVAVAESQLGYEESTENYTLADDGTTHQGYTRYGAWYAEGMEYADWDATFASFCLYYAGIDESAFPLNSGAYAWATELAKLGYYAEAADATPAVGDLVFFDENADTRPDRVGIVAAVENTSGNATEAEGSDEEANTATVQITVIEGDTETHNGTDAVAQTTYDSNNETILGYASVQGSQEVGSGLTLSVASEELGGVQAASAIEITWTEDWNTPTGTGPEKSCKVTIIVSGYDGLTPEHEYKYQLQNIPEYYSIEETRGSVTDSNSGMTIGTYAVDKKGLVTLETSDDPELTELTEFRGYISVNKVVRNLVSKVESNSPDTSNDLTGSYEIVVNGSQWDFSGETSLVIEDTASNLVYVAGTLAVKNNTSGEYLTLVEKEPESAEAGKNCYSVSWSATEGSDGSISGTLKIEIWYPEDDAYTISYDAQVKGPLTGTWVYYGNTASLTKTGDSDSDSDSRLEGNSVSAAGFRWKTLRAIFVKTNSETMERLSGAVYGLYTASGSLITRVESENDGSLCFKSNVPEGVVLHSNTQYYVKEITAPAGYNLDTTEHFFYFTDSHSSTTELKGTQIVIDDSTAAYYDETGGIIQEGYITLTDTPGAELPLTGGSGTCGYLLAGLALMGSAAYLGSKKMRHKQKPHS